MLSASQPPQPKTSRWLTPRTARARRQECTAQSSSNPIESCSEHCLPGRRSSLGTRPLSHRGSNYYLFLFTYNLVNSLARKFKCICNKSKRFSAVMQRHYLGISRGIGSRSWSQRAPLPSWNTFNFFDFRCGQLSLAATLAEVTNPRTQRLRDLLDVLKVGRGNVAVTLARLEGINGCNYQVESRDVVHGCDNSK